MYAEWSSELSRLNPALVLKCRTRKTLTNLTVCPAVRSIGRRVVGRTVLRELRRGGGSRRPQSPDTPAPPGDPNPPATPTQYEPSSRSEPPADQQPPAEPPASEELTEAA